MIPSIQKLAFHTTRLSLVASAIAAATAIASSGPAFAASPDYRFEVVQIASAGPGKSDVTVRLVRTNGTVVSDADLSANAPVDTVSERGGYGHFRVGTTTGPQTLQLSAKVPGPARVERTFNSSVKFFQTRTDRGADKLVAGTVVFNAS